MSRKCCRVDEAHCPVLRWFYKVDGLVPPLASSKYTDCAIWLTIETILANEVKNKEDARTYQHLPMSLTIPSSFPFSIDASITLNSS